MELENQELRQIIIEAVRAKEITETEAWGELDTLSGNTQVDTLETFEDEVRIEGQAFSGPLLWYVTLNYGKGDDSLMTSESFPGTFEGHLEEGQPVIDRMTADVSSFFE